MEDRRQTTRNDRGGTPYPLARLTVTEEDLPFFTTLLQYGIEIDTLINTPLGSFLGDCPGFSEDYILETVQTIFLNGTAIDDLQTPLYGPHPVVALSAAMPGLAGAIFRKNGIHSSLRTPAPASASNHDSRGPLTVTLKLFNRIAREKGERLLSSGAVMASSSLSDILKKRPELLDKIKYATFDAEPVPVETLSGVVRDHEFVKLFVSTAALP